MRIEDGNLEIYYPLYTFFSLDSWEPRTNFVDKIPKFIQ